MAISRFSPATGRSPSQVAFRFTAADNRGERTIDDVWVDPYKKR
jgi:hypothetical protein